MLALSLISTDWQQVVDDFVHGRNKTLERKRGPNWKECERQSDVVNVQQQRDLSVEWGWGGSRLASFFFLNWTPVWAGIGGLASSYEHSFWLVPTPGDLINCVRLGLGHLVWCPPSHVPSLPSAFLCIWEIIWRISFSSLIQEYHDVLFR